MNKQSMLILGIGILMLAGGAVFFMRNTSTTTTQPVPAGNSSVEETVVMDEETTSPAALSEEGSPLERNVKEFQVTGIPFSFSVKEMRVKQGDTVRVTFTNKEGMHDLVLDEFNVRTKVLPAGESQTIEFVADQVGEFTYYCSVGNHRQMGMVGKLIVE